MKPNLFLWGIWALWIALLWVSLILGFLCFCLWKHLPYTWGNFFLLTFFLTLPGEIHPCSWYIQRKEK